MPQPVIITCAPTGGIHTPTMSPHLPITPAQIATAAVEAAEAGAAIIHLHARNPDNGQPDPRPELFVEFMSQIAARCDAVLNVSTGGGLGMTRDERLRAALITSPEMASLNVGSLNFGLFPMLARHTEWKHAWEPEFLEMTRDFVFKNTFADIEYIVKELGHGHGTKFEFECYDLGHLYNLAWLIDQGWIEPPFFVQMVFGVLGGVGADTDNLHHMKTIADELFGDSYEWSVLAAGRHQMNFATEAAILGGNLRVGMEDSLYLGPPRPTHTRSARSAASSRRSATRSPPLTKRDSGSDSREPTVSTSDATEAGDITRVAALGAGLIGRSWTALFLAAAKHVTVYDADPSIEQNVRDAVDAAWPVLTRLGLVSGPVPHGNLVICTDPRSAVDGAQFVQESIPEQLALKHDLYRTIEPALDRHAVIASSASGLTLLGIARK